MSLQGETEAENICGGATRTAGEVTEGAEQSTCRGRGPRPAVQEGAFFVEPYLKKKLLLNVLG